MLNQVIRCGCSVRMDLMIEKRLFKRLSKLLCESLSFFCKKAVAKFRFSQNPISLKTEEFDHGFQIDIAMAAGLNNGKSAG